MKTTIFDLDYTLFDAKRFRDECLAPFFGMTGAEFNEYYKINFKDKGVNFAPQELLQAKGLTEEALDVYLDREIGQYLFPQVETILRLYRESCERLVLASFGNQEWQRRKIDHLKLNGEALEGFFDEVILEDKSKAENEIMRSILGDEVEIINDNQAESEKLLKFFGEKARLRLIQGPYSTEGYKDLGELGSEIFPKAYYNEVKFKIA